MNGAEMTISQWAFDMTGTAVIETELVLPDYCPDLQALIRSQAAVRLKERRIEPGKITVEGVCIFTEIFRSEGEDRLRSLIQSQEFTYSFSVDKIPAGFTVTARVAEVSGRLLQARKMAVNASVILEVKGYEEKTVAVPEAQPALFMKTEQVKGMHVCASNTRSFKLVEELEVKETDADVEEVLAADASVWVQESKIISEKAVLRGVAEIHLLYVDANGVCKHMEKEVPFNQVVDLEGVEENCCLYAYMEITSLKVSVSADGQSEGRNLAAALEIEAYARACRSVDLTVVTDAYATDSQLTMEKTPLSVCGIAPVQTLETAVETEVEGGKTIVFAGVNAIVTDARLEQYRLVICGKAEVELLCCDADGNYVNEKQTKEFSVSPETVDMMDEVRLDCEAVVRCVSIEGGRCTVRIAAGVQLNEVRNVETVIRAEKNGEALPSCECEAYLYYVNGDENLWEVAKRYRTSPDVLSRENALTDRDGAQRVLFVPVLK